MLTITTEYLWVVLMFSPFFLLNTVIQCFVRNDGAPRLVMMGTLFGSLFNIVFDYIFIFPMGLGMFGAALATGCSPIVSLLVLSSHCLKKHNHFHCMRLGPRPAIAQDIARLGSAGFVTEVANGVVIFCFNAILLRLAGDVGVAAYGVIMYVNFIFAAIFMGYAIGSAPVVGYHYGAEHHDELKNLLNKSLRLVAAAALVLTALSELLARPLTQIFVGYDPELWAFTCHGFQLYSLSFLFSGFNVFGSSFFTALNNGLVSAGISFSRTLLFQVAAVLLLPLVLGVDGIWLAITVAELLCLLVTAGCLVKLRSRYHYA